ncbi:MAG: sugar transferase [Maribacter sp.]
MYKLFLKRIIDILVASIVLILSSPLIVVTYLVLSTQGKAFFVQKRPGKNEKVFSIVKFKSMNDKKDANGELLPDEQRITAFGHFVRKSSVDELPQLWNVLKGDMSIIGPRPLLVDYLDLYTEEQRKRHAVRPGITGWAQVNGRNAISWKKKFEYDIWYVEHMGFLLDLKIIWKTILKVVKSEGVGSNTGATGERFTGHN